MRNLQTCLDVRQELPLPYELGDVVHFAVDSDAGVIFVAGSGLGVAAYRTSDCEVSATYPIVQGQPATTCQCCTCGRRRRRCCHWQRPMLGAATPIYNSFLAHYIPSQPFNRAACMVCGLAGAARGSRLSC